MKYSFVYDPLENIDVKSTPSFFQQFVEFVLFLYS